MAVAAGEGRGRAEGVDDRFFGRVGGGLEERRHGVVRQHPHGERVARAARAVQPLVAGREGQEDVAAAILTQAAHPRDAERRALRQAAAAIRQ
jgi:hypothetical protein